MSMVAVFVATIMLAFGKGDPNGNWDGTFRTFDIDISLYGKYDANSNKQSRTDEEKAKYGAILTNFAYVVYEATDGKHRIGKVDIYSDYGGGWKVARDIIWTRRLEDKKEGTAAYTDYVRYGPKSRGSIHCADEVIYNCLENPGLAGACLAHEWGHLTYGFLDEYNIKSSKKVTEIENKGFWGSPFTAYYYNVSGIETVSINSLMGNKFPKKLLGILDVRSLDSSVLHSLNFSVPTNYQGSDNVTKSASWKWARSGLREAEIIQMGTWHELWCGQSCWEQFKNPHNSDVSRDSWFPNYYQMFTPLDFCNDFKEMNPIKNCGTIQLTDPNECRKAIAALNIVWHDDAPVQLNVCTCDISGSMGAEGVQNVIAQAQMLISNLPEGTYFGLKSFNDTITTVIPITQITESNRASIKNRVSSIGNASGGTALWDAAWASLDDIFSFAAAHDVEANLILLTDGQESGASEKADENSVIARCKELGVKLNGVAYGAAADVKLKSVSEATGGKHYKSGQDSSELGGAFLRTLAGTSSRVVLADYPCEVAKPMTIEKSFYVDSSLTNVHMSVIISHSRVASALANASGVIVSSGEADFISPSGKKYCHSWGNAGALTPAAIGTGNTDVDNYTVDATSNGDSQSYTLRLAKPEIGEWKICARLYGPTKTTIFADANIIDWGPELHVDVLKNSGIVRALLLNGHSITGAHVVATVPCKGYSLEVPFELSSSGFYTAPIEAFGPEAKTRGYTVSATIREGEARVNLDDNFVCDDESSGSVAVSESATRAEYIPGEGVEESFEGVAFGDGCCVSKTVVSSRWPFAGLVDIDYMLSGYQPGISAKVSVMGRDHDLNVEMPATTLTGAGVTTPATNGWNRVTWNLAKDYPNFHAMEFSVKVTAESLMTPTSIEASDGTDANAVIVTWTGKSASVSYEIWRGSSDSFDSATKLGTTTSTRYVDNAAIPGADYYYWVRPIIGSSAGACGMSDSGYRPIMPPTSVSATSGIVGCVQISWNSVEYAKAYQVYRSTSANMSGAVSVGFSTSTTFNDTGMAAGDRYYYWIQSVGQNRVSELSSVYGSGYSKPATPTGIVASDGTSTSYVTVTWNSITGGRKYKVYRSENALTSGATCLGTVEGTSYNDTTAQIAKPYYYFVKAVGNACESEFSEGDAGFRAATLTGTALYLVVDLSLGPNAVKYPCYEISSIPDGSWSQEYKTAMLVLRRIEAGSFYMGSSSSELGRDSSNANITDETRHKVTLTKPFYIGVFEVTQKQYELVKGDNPTGNGYGDARPVANVKYWEHARCYRQMGDTDSFISRIRSRTGLNFDLPTEAQWEYACRAGTTTSVNNGKNITNTASDSNMSLVARYVYNKSSGVGGYNGHTTVGSYAPNAWGLYDMHGNVAEWCIDFYGRFTSESVTDPTGANLSDVDAAHVCRGGCYEDSASNCRSASRGREKPKNGHYNNGMRLAMPIQ